MAMYSFIAILLFATTVTANLDPESFKNITMKKGGEEIHLNSVMMESDSKLLYVAATQERMYIRCDYFTPEEAGSNCEGAHLLISFLEDSTENVYYYCGQPEGINLISTKNQLLVVFNNTGNSSVDFSCTVRNLRTLGEPFKMELKKNDVKLMISRRKNSPKAENSWSFKTAPNYQVELTCYINLNKTTPCKDVLLIQTHDGLKEYCGFDNLVVFTKLSKVTATVILDETGKGRVFCTARAALNEDEATIDQKRQAQPDQSLKITNATTATFPCGWTKWNRKVTDGPVASANEFPWMAVVEVSLDAERTYTCSGVIITHYHVLTAGHCIWDIHSDSTINPVVPHKIAVYVGGHNLGSGPNIIARAKHHARIVSFRSDYHRNYTPDIAIVTVYIAIGFTRTVGPICVPPTGSNLENEIVSTMGWGKMNSTRILQKANVQIVNKEECAITEDSHFCIRAFTGTSCSGDSGGAIVTIDPKTSRYTLLGINIRPHQDCVSTGAVALNTTHYYSWMQSIVSGSPGESMQQ